jgi:quercetin dioxygenase-like cupin family protein
MERDDAASISRLHLLTGPFGTRVERIEAHRVQLPPGKQSGRHHHVGGVVGYVEQGEILFEVEGRPTLVLRAGDVFCEPPDAVIERFDNASSAAAASFVAFYCLAGDQPLITMLG